MSKRGTAHIGTSGWHYKHWVGRFYPEKTPARRMLEFYFGVFDTVEINNTFYSLPAEETLTGWREATPPDFLFSVKASRFITHMKKLKEPEKSLEKFVDRIAGLAPKVGPVLFQLPPSWHVNTERLEAFLAALAPGARYVFEFRDPSWHCDEVRELLARHNAALCQNALPSGGDAPPLTADWVYLRLHGPGPELYVGSYSDEELREGARIIETWIEKGMDVYAYFDNDTNAHAPNNARTLKGMVK